jgi:phage tail-like protein
MPQFNVNSHRFDPYKNFKFRVRWDDRYVAGVSKMSALKLKTEPVPHKSAGDHTVTRKSPGRTEYDPVTLERGVTHDPDFENWARRVWDYRKPGALVGFRKDIIIDLYNEAGQLAMSYTLYRCWVSAYQSLPDLDANGGAIAIQSITLENEGWERDTTLKEEPEPQLALEPE